MLIPTSLISFDVFTLITFDIEYALGDRDKPVMTIFGTVSPALTTVVTVKTNGDDVDGVPVKLPDKAGGVPENNPEGRVIVIVSAVGDVTSAFVTFNEIVNVPPDALLIQAAVPLTRPPATGIHFFTDSSHEVPTSQQPGP